MNVHKNAKLTPRGRAEIVRRVLDLGQTPKAVATAFGVCERAVRKWVARFRAEGSEGLQDRSSRPHTLRRPTPAPVVRRIAALRRRRCTGAQIAAELGISTATVSRVLRRLGLRPPQGARSARAGAPLRTRAPRRADPHRHQEARPLRPTGPPRHRRPHRPQQQPRRRLGVSARLHRRPLPPSPSARSCPTRRRKAPPPSSRPPLPTTTASASPSKG